MIAPRKTSGSGRYKWLKKGQYYENSCEDICTIKKIVVSVDDPR
jgi:hypothetical protein